MKVLKLFMIGAGLLLVIEWLSGFHMFISEDDWATREDVAAYIEENYPGKTYHLAEAMKKDWSNRDWLFTMDDYPGCEFKVADVPTMTLLPVFDHTRLQDNVYAILQGKATNAFTATIEPVYGKEACGFWKGVRKDDGMAPIIIEINNISQFDIVGKMVAGYQTYFKDTYPGFAPAYFIIRMQMNDPVTRLVDTISNPPRYYHTGFWDIDEGMEWNYSDYSYTDAAANQAKISVMRRNVIEYASIYYYNIAGVTNEMRNAFAQKAVHKAKSDFENIHRHSYTVISTGSGPNLYAVTDGSSGSNPKLYVTRQTAYEFFRQCGLAVSDEDKYRESFTVVGVDGSTYQFMQTYNMKKCVYTGKSYDYTIDGEKYSFDDGSVDINNGFEVNSELIKRITGIDIATGLN